MSVPDLAYVALAARDPDLAAGVLERHLGLARRETRTPAGAPVPLLTVGASALAVFAVDDPFLGEGAGTGVHHIAVAAAEPEAYLAGLGLADGAIREEGLDGARALRLDPAATCGVRLRVCEPLEAAAGGGDPVERMDHVGVASPDNAAATAFFSGTLGLPVESTQTDLEVHTATETFTSDRYGVVHRHRPPRIVGGLRVAFITLGDCELEFLEPFAPDETGEPDGPLGRGPGNTGGDKSAIGRYLERHGAGLHHLALKVRDIDATLGALAAGGVSMIDREGRPGSRRARIGFFHPRALAGILVHLVERDEL